MHHKLALPVLVALCISSSFGFADAKNGPNWSRSNRVQPPAAKRQLSPRDDQILAIVRALGFDDPGALTNGPTSTTSTTSVTSTSTSTSSTSTSSSSSSSSDSSSSTSTTSDSSSSTSSSTTDPGSSSSTSTTDSTSPTSSDPSSPSPTPTPTTTVDPLSSILSGILDPLTSSNTGSDTLTLIGSDTPTPTPTPTPTDPITTDSANTDTATTTPIDISSVLSSILSSLTDTSSPTDTIIGTDGPTSTDTSSPTNTDTGIPPTSTDTAGPTGPTDTITTDTNTGTGTGTGTGTDTVSPTSTTTPFDPNNTSLFPTTTTSLDPGDATTITTQPPTTLPTPTDYGYLTGTSLALSTTATTASGTNTDPDAPTSIITSIDPTTTPTGVPVLPADLPMKIVPADNTAASMTPDQLSKYTAITILFNSQMPWKSVLDSSELLGQILAFFGGNIAHALGLDPSQVITTSLAAYAKAGWSQTDPDALSTLSTTWNGLVPTELVSDLSAQILNQNSPFYTGTTGIPKQLADLVVPTFSILSSNSGSNGGVAVGANAAGGGTSAPTDTSKNTIIGVTTTVGVILVLLIAFFLVKMYKRSRESAHRRLSGEPMTGPAMRSYGSQGFTGGAGAGAGGSMGQGNRDSFFFAEDSLRGYQHDGTGSVEDDDSYTSHQPSQARRAPIQASAISQPILRESSMGNW